MPIELQPPEIAIAAGDRNIWHLQRPTKKNKTICGIVIASGRGHKYRNEAHYEILRKNKIIWRRSNIDEIKAGRFCETCLGPLIAVTVSPIDQQSKLKGF